MLDKDGQPAWVDNVWNWPYFYTIVSNRFKIYIKYIHTTTAYNPSTINNTTTTKCA